MKELGLSRYFTGSFLLRHQKKYAPTRRAKNSKGTITAAAMAPPLIVDFDVAPAVGEAVELVVDDDVDDVDDEVEDEVEDEDEDEDEVELELEVVEEVDVEEVVVVVADVDIGLKVIAVNTICNFRSFGMPLNVDSMVVASDEEPQSHAEYPPAYLFM